jgi:hypothetical protein
LPGRYKAERAFAATSGTLPVRITVLLVAAFAGACPNLRADMLCGIYEERPAVCRIYPAEISPFVALAPEAKACPPEAWAETTPLLLRDGAVTDGETAAIIARSRRAAVAGVAAKAALSWGKAAPDVATPPWRIVSNRTATLAMLADAGAEWGRAERQPFDYLGFFPAD